MEINKCNFCDKCYPGKDGQMKCQASNYELKYDNACGKALDRMMQVMTVERLRTAEPTTVTYSTGNPGDVLDRLFGR